VADPATLLEVAPAWRQGCPGASVGILALRGAANPPADPAVAAEADAQERELRAAWTDRDALRSAPPFPAYAAWYKRFGQRYHVMLQRESVALKGKPVPRVAGLVEAMFLAELRTGILLAGHDLDAVALPLSLGVGTGEERYRTPRGEDAVVKPGDMWVGDREGVLSAVVTGPAERARIEPGTTAALYVAYAPAGVPAADVAACLARIERTVRGFAPGVAREALLVVEADPA
jgi:DNA/RNA-binding domain of Phe-tRNA-synthetase-like protein